MKPIAVIPTLCTLAGAFCGFLAISKGADAVGSLAAATEPGTAEALVAFREPMRTACYLIFGAMVFDALDGRIARMTNQTSDFGALLDSLTDMLTFGAAPALLLKFHYEAMARVHGQSFQPKVILLLTALYLCCAALRLARFTAETDDDPESHDFFAGLPTPAAAGLISASLLFYMQLDPAEPGFLTFLMGDSSAHRFIESVHRSFLPGLILLAPLLGLLMISRARYVHIVNRYMRGKRPYTYVAQIVFVVFLLALWPREALFVALLLYVFLCPLLSVLESMLGRKIVPRTHPPQR